MSTSEALNGGFTIMLGGASLATSFFLPAEISVLLLLLSYRTAVYATGLMVGNNSGWFDTALNFFWKLILLTIIVFAVIYWRYGLISNGKEVEISVIESLYFSVTTWTTLGYGDFSPTPRIRHITSVQAILGYVGLGLWVSLMSGFMNNLTTMRKEINEHNEKLFASIKEKDNGENNP